MPPEPRAFTPLRDSESGFARPLPYNTAAEQALLGAILIDNRAFERVGEFLLPEHFGNGIHGRIFEAIGKLVERGQVANPVTLKTLFDQDGDLAQIGGAQYLVQLAGSAVTIINAEDYGRTVLDLAKRRRLIWAAEDLIERAHKIDLETTAEDLISAHEMTLSDIQGAEQKREFTTIGAAAQEALERSEIAFKAGGKITGIATGLVDLDNKLNGLQPGDVILIGGRPSMGKTALGVSIATHAAEALGLAVGIFEMEQSSLQLAQRELAARADVSTMRQRKGDLDMLHWTRLAESAAKLRDLPVYIDDSAGLTIAEIRRRARRMRQRQGISLIVADHMQLIATEGRRVEELSKVSGTLKIIAKELGLPVLALAQLSRRVEEREDKRPMLADLRESGSIEQDADVVIFVFREEYYLAREEPRRRAGEADDKFNDRHDRWQTELDRSAGIAELIIAKQREGPTGTVKVRWDKERMRFENLAREYR